MDSDDSYLDEYTCYNDDDEEEEEDVGYNNGKYWGINPQQGTYCGLRPSFLYGPRPHSVRRYITPEEANRNAEKLLEEERREKEKADKKRLKKKRQKDRKRQQKLQEGQNDQTSSEKKVTATGAPDNNSAAQNAEAKNDDKDSSVSGSDDDLDLKSSFVRQAQKRMENKPKPERRERAKERSWERATERSKERAPEGSRERVPASAQERVSTQQPAPPPPQDNINILDRYRIQESMDLANIGNNMASRERFSEALQYYTDAIELNPTEYRFLGNRSYVYDRLDRYKEALLDAENALKLQPHFLKGYFRKGKALKGLKRYSEAIAAFQQVLLFDMNHVEAAAEILQCQKKVQEAMATPSLLLPPEAMTSTRVKIHSNAPLSPPATPSTSVPVQNNKVFVPRNIYNTKADARTPAAGRRPSPVIVPSILVQSEFYPIWVGNLTDMITENILRSKFEPFGVVHSVHILSNRRCAFINFISKDSAEAAFRSLQGLIVDGAKFILQLKKPTLNVPVAPGAKKIGK